MEKMRFVGDPTHSLDWEALNHGYFSRWDDEFLAFGRVYDVEVTSPYGNGWTGSECPTLVVVYDKRRIFRKKWLKKVYRSESEMRSEWRKA